MWLVALFSLWSVGFWILSVIAAIILIACVENESPVGGTFDVLIYLALLQLVSGVHILQWAFSHPLHLGIAVLVYLVAGTFWSVFKWSAFCHFVASYFKERKEVWLKENASRYKMSDALDSDLRKHLADKYHAKSGVYGRDLPIQVASNKQRIITWMMWWPASMLWTAIDDFVRRAFEHIFNSIRGVLQGISNKMFAGVTFNESD